MLNNNFQRILFKFGLWLATGILICLVGISGVFADTYQATQFTVEGYDNYGPSLSKVTTDFTNNSWRWTIPSMVANSAGTAFIFNSPIPIIADHTYTVTAQIENSWGTCINLSTFNRIGLGTTISNSKSSYENNTNVNENYSNSSSCNIVQFAFTPTINGTWLTIPFTTTSNANNVTFTINELIINDLGSKSLSQSEINNSLTTQTNTLNNSITNSTNSIVNNSNSNKNEIIENQNTNNDKLIESNQQLLGECNTNIFSNNKVNSLYNMSYQNGKYIQIQADNNTHPNLKLQYWYNGSYVGANDYTPQISINRFKYTFVKNSTFDELHFGVNGSTIDSTINYDVSNLTNQQLYTLIFDVENITQGSITISNVMLIKGNSIFNEYIPEGESKCISKIDSQINNANQNTQDIINNQNQNNQNVINNNNQNTQDIIANQNANNEALIDDNKKNFQSCRDSYNLFSGQLSQFQNINGSTSNPYAYFKLPKENTKYTLTVIAKEDYTVPSNTYLGFTGNGGNSSGGFEFIILNNRKFTKGQILTISNNDYNYVSLYRPTGTTLQTIIDHFDIQLQEGEFTGYEPYGEEICVNKLDEQNKQLNDLNSNLNDDDSSGATNEASDFFNSFNTNTFGLTSIITAPLNLIQSLTSSTCSELHLPLPYLNNKYLDLPCMTSIYQTHFGTFFTMYQTITYGIIAYWVCVRIFNQVKDFKNPEHDEIEVVDL